MKLNFGLNLKMLREKSGLSQEELANHIGVKSPAISKYEKNQAEPKLEYLAKFCEIFEVTMDELVFGSPTDQNRLTIESYKARLRELEEHTGLLEKENDILKQEKDDLQQRLIKALERALKQK